MVKQIVEHLKNLGLGVAIISGFAAAVIAVFFLLSFIINFLGDAFLPTICAGFLLWISWGLGQAIREDRETEIIEEIPIPHYPKDRK